MNELIERLLDLPSVRDIKLVAVPGGYGVILRTIDDHPRLVTDERVKNAIIGAVMVADQRL